jgi:hypothetical protein
MMATFFIGVSADLRHGEATTRRAMQLRANYRGPDGPKEMSPPRAWRNASDERVVMGEAISWILLLIMIALR